MQLALPFIEAIALMTAENPLPPMIRAVRCEGSTVHADVDLRPSPTRAAARRRGGGYHRRHRAIRELL
jgi:hypothetical protein